MNKKLIIVAITCLSLLTGCVKNFDPQDSFVTKKQVADAPNAFNDLTDAITNDLVGGFPYGGNSGRANDFGLSAMYIKMDVSGQDMLPGYLNWWDAYYTVSWLGPTTANAQVPWTYFYGWIKSCNTVIGLVGDNEPAEHQKAGLGIAHTMRAYYYWYLAQMFVNEPYSKNPEAITVPILTEKTSKEELTKNPRATYKDICAFMIADLDKAENLLKDYKRSTKEMPDLSVVYGMKARVYLLMCDWSNAEKYAKLAQKGYTLMTGEQYTDRNTGFNTPNDAWMLCMTYKPTDPAIIENDGDTSWGSHMMLEIDPVKNQCGYASNYGQPQVIDRHLYETMPESDARKLCFVDFKINDLQTVDEQVNALKKYSDYPTHLFATGVATWGEKKDAEGKDLPDEQQRTTKVGGLSLKFRVAGGAEGRFNQYKAYVASIPMMRVEEMHLIEAEAAGMQNEAKGIELLTKFAKTRDANFTYGTHNEDYYGNNSAFQNEIWWQRRVEFWGEGLSMFDIKRFGKGIIRSYKNTNHHDGYRWNMNTTPDWMNFCIVDTETNYNPNKNNPAPSHVNENDPEFTF
ncbi:RagB/SusD family nutrient uptake outer membrane protein [Porphyromonas levii]|uniref:RagB/SusD family nutrient uptake outer membrane protein n=1 Tax=Porphyromonas levii TaxID=28114 RepID=UPI001B8A9D82|nr:RagB/SusD family nutrient uptake outer membrane protein [Porphyromonas levii]MBR8759966.1 hypothetical protein [Porphyromonas levii]